MRLGAHIPNNHDNDPEAWIGTLQEAGYRAAYCPLPLDADPATIQAFEDAAQAADIVIAEVGAWSNPLSPDDDTRKAALEKCKNALQLADAIGAKCCVNVAGSRGDKWDGPHVDDLTDDTFDLIVETVREIVDDVQPYRAFYTLEPMPWMFPDSPENYLRLIEAIDRKMVAVHLDPVNWISSPQRYFNNTAFIKECFRLLGPHIKSIHAKDITLGDKLTVHLDEVRPGLGYLDYHTLLCEVEALNPELPVMLEHLPTQEDYRLATEYVRSVAWQANIEV